LPHREIDVLVVFDRRIGPELGPNPIARDDRAGRVEKEREQACRLRLQHAALAVAPQNAGRRLKHVRDEDEHRPHHAANYTAA